MGAFGLHDDGRADLIQLSTKHHERYQSCIEKYPKFDGTIEFKLDMGPCDQLDHIFAKRCEEKNPTYIPIDFTKENEIYDNIKKDRVRFYTNARKLQISQNREKMSYQEEQEMLKNAFEKGVVRIATNELLDWEKANKLANERAGGLCTREELENSGLKYVDGVDL